MVASEDASWPFVGGVAALLAHRAGIPLGAQAPQLDVRKALHWQTKDIDLFVGHAGSPYLAVEAKIDSYASGQVPIEFLSNTVRGTPGWAWYCEANRLVFIRPAIKRALVLDWKPIQRRLIALRERWPLMETSTPTRGGSLYSTVCRLVPVRDLLAMHRPDGRPLAREYPLCVLADITTENDVVTLSHELPPHQTDRHPAGARRTLSHDLTHSFVSQEQSWASRWDQAKTNTDLLITQKAQVPVELRLPALTPRTRSPRL